MSKKGKAKTYSCLNCGSPFQAYPPDDRHTIATRNKDDYEDHIQVNYRCKDCSHTNTIYWGHAKPFFVVG